MSNRSLVLLRAALAAVVVTALAAVPAAQTANTAKNTYKAPRTADGHPDLQGIWNNTVSTPLERPATFAGKDRLTTEELKQRTVQAQRSRDNRDRRDQKEGSVTDVGRAYNAFWFPVPGDPIDRTSLIVDPPDGRVPPLTPAALKRFADYSAKLGRFASAANPAGRNDIEVEDGTEGGVDGRGTRADHPEDRRLSERCLIFGGVPRLPGGYNNHLRIVQSRDHVVIELEQIHDARIIPLDGRPHIPSTVRQWLGDPRGRWEGETLVVETTNFNNKNPFRGSFENLQLIERFTRTGPNTIMYSMTVSDPTTFTRSWTAEWPYTNLKALVGGVDGVTSPEMYEYACHEGNIGLVGQLSGARAMEKKAGEQSKR
jgi:hypothetical protein